MHSAGAASSRREIQPRLLEPTGQSEPQPVGARVVALARLAAAIHMARAADAARADADAASPAGRKGERQ